MRADIFLCGIAALCELVAIPARVFEAAVLEAQDVAVEDEKDEGEEDDSANDHPADRQAMTASGMPYDDEEPDYDNEPEKYI